jgi:hypothetical protein
MGQRQVTALMLDLKKTPAVSGAWRGLRLAPAGGGVRGPEKYRILDLKRRRALIRARRELELV